MYIIMYMQENTHPISTGAVIYCVLDINFCSILTNTCMQLGNPAYNTYMYMYACTLTLRHHLPLSTASR